MSADYFESRIDQYILVNSPSLCKFLTGLSFEINPESGRSYYHLQERFESIPNGNLILLNNNLRDFFASQSHPGDFFVKTPYFSFPLKSCVKNSSFEIITCGLNSNSFIKNKNLRWMIPFVYRSIHNSVLISSGSKVHIKIYHYAKMFLHSKSIILKSENSNFLIIGSSNFNVRSFERDVETDFLLLNPPSELLDYCSQNRDKILRVKKRETGLLDNFFLLFRNYF